MPRLAKCASSCFVFHVSSNISFLWNEMDLTLKIVALFVMVTTSSARLLHYQIITGDDGVREIRSNQSPSSDLRILAKDINASLTQLNESATPDAATDFLETLNEVPSHISAKNISTNQPLINQRNSNALTGQKNTVYANSTKLLVYNDLKESYQTPHQSGRAENITYGTIEKMIPTEQSGLWEVFERLYDCFSSDEKFASALSCFKMRATSIFYRFIDQSLSSATGKSGEEKTLLHGKKVLKGALLPLLVLLVIKYLVALPVIAAGLITIKTFWLSLLSAGVAAFGAPWKQQHIIKRHRPDESHVWNQPPWTVALHSNDGIGKIGDSGLMRTVTDRFYM